MTNSGMHIYVFMCAGKVVGYNRARRYKDWKFFFDAFFFVIDRNLKQGVCDVLQFFDQNVGSHDTTDIGLQKLLSFLKASSQTHK